MNTTPPTRPHGSVRSFTELEPNVFAYVQKALCVLSKLDRANRTIPSEARVYLLRLIGLSTEHNKSTVEDLVRSYRLWEDKKRANNSRLREKRLKEEQERLTSSGDQGRQQRKNKKRARVGVTFKELQNDRRETAAKAHATTDMQHARESAFKCASCDFTTNNGNEMNVHTTDVHTERLQGCAQCGTLRGRSNTDIIRHERLCQFDPFQRTSTGDRLVQCELDCLSMGYGPHEVYFESKHAMLCHVAKAEQHATDSRRTQLLLSRHSCPKCSRCLSGLNLIGHVQRCRVTKEFCDSNTFICGECKLFSAGDAKHFRFSSMDDLTKHKSRKQHKNTVNAMRGVNKSSP